MWGFTKNSNRETFVFLKCNSTLLHLPPLRFHCVGGCWDLTQDHRVGRVLSVSPVVGIGTPPPLQPQASVPPHPLVRGGGHTRLRLKGLGSPNSNEGTFTVVLYIYKYFVPRTVALARQKLYQDQLHLIHCYFIELPADSRQPEKKNIHNIKNPLHTNLIHGCKSISYNNKSPYCRVCFEYV